MNVAAVINYRPSTILWNVEQTDLLVKLWTDELSCSAIAAELNHQTGSHFSRNAVIGKVHRLSLPTRGSSFQYQHLTDEQKAQRKRKRDATFRERRRQASTHARRINSPRLFLVSAPSINDLEIPVGQRKTLAQLDNCHCRWPVGEPGSPGFFFCGAPEADVHRGRSYCPSHQVRSIGRAA